MKRAFILCSLLCLQTLIAQTEPAPDDAWDIVQAYGLSTYVFYGEVSKVLPEPEYATGLMGVSVPDIDDDLELPLEPIIWKHAKEFTFTVDAQFKETMPERFVAYLPDPDPRIWIHQINQAGDVLLTQAKKPNALMLKLNAGDRGLFFVRKYSGSSIPIIYQARFGQPAQDDIALLEAYQAASHLSLESISNNAREKQAAAAKREAAEFKVFEDDYYKILRIQDLEIRRSMLNDLIERMGFTDLWTYFEFKERYLERYGAHVDESTIPSGPTTGKEKLWHDASGELKKIEVILKARAR